MPAKAITQVEPVKFFFGFCFCFWFTAGFDFRYSHILMTIIMPTLKNDQNELSDSGNDEVILAIKLAPMYEKETPVSTVSKKTQTVKSTIFARERPVAIPEATRIAPTGSIPAIPSKIVEISRDTMS
jgi:hypothetical protein